jgi:ribonucleoside-diphosphate reductase alpha chain
VGVGFGISKRFLARLPELVSEKDKTGTIINYAVEDTIEGWADSVEALLMCYFKNTPYTGRKIVFDYSKIRKKGARLKTGGGKAPGYKGLKAAHIKIKELLDEIIEEKKQWNLKPINAYDILMHCADAVLSGGIRRAATATIFDEDDDEMINCKTSFNVDKIKGFYQDEDTKKWSGIVQIGKKKYHVNDMDDGSYNWMLSSNTISWFNIEPQRARSNNSVLILRKNLTKEKLKSIIDRTKAFGEPGFVFADHQDQLFNPCFEIGFIPVTEDGTCGVQFCNLTSINGAKIKDLNEFKLAAKAATIIGTLQAGYTNFPYLHHSAKKLTEDEALLGVSITGMMDNPDILLNPEYQREVSEYVKEINKMWAKKIGINSATRSTTCKPEGSSSLILESASGIHPHHAHKYFRRVQMNKADNVFNHFKKYNPHMIEESKWSANKTDDIVTFPIEIPKKAMVKKDLNALKHLEIVKSTQQNWVIPGTDKEQNKKGINHNVSVTVIVKEEEWDGVIDYLFENKEYFTAVSFIGASGDKDYVQAPNEEITTEDDEKMFNYYLDNYVPVDYSTLVEDKDETEFQQTLSCAGNNCEIPF